MSKQTIMLKVVNYVLTLTGILVDMGGNRFTVHGVPLETSLITTHSCNDRKCAYIDFLMSI